MRLAQFKSLTYGTVIILNADGAPYISDEYVQVSEWVDVEFPQRTSDAAEQLKKLAKKEAELRVALGSIEAQRSRLQGTES